MQSLPRQLLERIRRHELLHAGDRIGVAVSGGIDSVALLRLLQELRQELGIVLSVVHFNHKLRGTESDADQEFVAGLAREDGLEFYCSSGDVAGLAAEQHSGMEAAAREMRHLFFRELVAGTSGVLDKIATGHTLDDQAETVLMRLIRGTGMRGLGGIYPRVVVEDEYGDECGEIVRPLLGMRRRELEQYLREIGRTWREDATNSDSAFTRNRVRKLVLPLLEREFNPAVVENLAELAEIARDEEDYWENEVAGWLGTVVQGSQPESPSQLVQILPTIPAVEQESVVETPGEAGEDSSARAVPRVARDDRGSEGNVASEIAPRLSLSRPWLLTEPRAVQRRVLKSIGEQAGIPLEFKHVEEILRFAAEDGPSGKELALPLGWKAVRDAKAIAFTAPDLRRQERIRDYEYKVSIPGQVRIPELESTIEILRIKLPGEMAEYNPQQLLRADLLPGQLLVRNWRPGDRFWPAHTKSAKKVKELLQERHVAQPERRLWPVLVCGEEIVWMRGFPAPAKLRPGKNQEAVLIRELPWAQDENAI